jgi:hypothetical protein
MQIEEIAKVAHEVNRSYCLALGDDSQVPWEEAPDWQKDSAINGVKFHLAHPGVTPAMSHSAWLLQKDREGWTWGEVKDVERKQHPCFTPYDNLPVEQKAKDYIFSAVVAQLTPFLTQGE